MSVGLRNGRLCDRPGHIGTEVYPHAVVLRVFRDFNGQPLNGGDAQTGAAPEFKDNLWFGLTSNIFTASLFDPTNHNENLNP